MTPGKDSSGIGGGRYLPRGDAAPRLGFQSGGGEAVMPVYQYTGIM